MHENQNKLPKYICVFLAFGMISCISDLEKSNRNVHIDERVMLDSREMDFTIPHEWSLVQRPSGVNNLNVYVIAKRNWSKELTISIDMGYSRGISENSQEMLHGNFLKIVKSDFPEARMALSQTIVINNKTSILIFHYTGNDGQQLVAFVPNEKSVIRVSLNAQTNEEIKIGRRAFLAVLYSLKCCGPNYHRTDFPS